MSDSDITPPADAKGEDDISDINHDKAGRDNEWMFEKLNKHLAALKLVRVPGKGRLTVGEAVETTLAQAEAYEKWCRFGAPGGVIEVWVEDKRVMALDPDDATDLQGVLFEAAGMPKAVVQVVRCADEIADTVVLLNRELRDVLYKGGRCEQRHPNNRHVTLEVKRESRGQLSFWVGFNQAVEVSTGRLGILGILGRLKDRATQAGACLLVRAEHLKEAWGLPALGMATAVGLVLLSCAGVAYSSREQTFAPAADARDAASTAKPLVAAAALNNTLARSGAHDFVETDDANTSGAESKQSAAAAPDANKGAARARTPRPRLADTQVNVVAPKDEPVPEGVDGVVLTTLPEQVSSAAAAAESSPWDARRLQRLAEVQKVVLKLDDGTSLDKAQADDLLKSVGEALKGLGIIALTDETEKRTADGEMLLRFEPDTTLLGAIFATIRDRDGNFLWADHAGCRITPDDSGWGATFGDASARLISKLQPRTKVASVSSDEKTRPVTGSKTFRPSVRLSPAAPGSPNDALGYKKGRVSMTQVSYEPK